MLILQLLFLRRPLYNGHCSNTTAWTKSDNLTIFMKRSAIISAVSLPYLMIQATLKNTMTDGKFSLALLAVISKRSKPPACCSKWRLMQDSRADLNHSAE